MEGGNQTETPRVAGIFGAKLGYTWARIGLTNIRFKVS